MNPRTQESTADTKPPLTDCALPKSTTQGDCAGAGIHGSKGRKLTLEQWDQRLQALGVRDATFDQTAARAFELPASGALPKSTTEGGCSGGGIPGSKGRKYTPEEIRKRLLELGCRDATLDPTAPRAFELPASGISPQKQG